MNCVFAMSSLEWLILTTRSMCFSDLPCSGDFVLGNHRRSTTHQRPRLQHRVLSWDGTYPQTAFVKTICDPQGNKQGHFAKMQEAARKHVGRAFEVPQARWGIICGSAMMWESETFWQLMTCCVILHTMLGKDEGDEAARNNNFWQAYRTNPNHETIRCKSAYQFFADASEASRS